MSLVDSVANDKMVPPPALAGFLNCFNRVWKGIFGIRDLTKIWCGNRENYKYNDGIRDLTVPGKRDSPKTGHGTRDLCLRVGWECWKPSRPISSSGQSKSTRRALSGVSFQTKHPIACLVSRL